MKARELTVVMSGRVAGRIVEQEGRLRLRYDPGYRGVDATPLSVSLPTELPDHAHGPVSAFLWGLLPDDERVLRRWARDYQVSAASPVALLSSPVGADCAGAVQFVDPSRADALLERPGSIDWLTESDVAAKIRGLRSDSATWLGERIKTGQFSLAGAQAKTALRFDPNLARWGVPHGPEPTSHILKPGISDLEGHALNEHLCLAAAHHLGLRAAHSTHRMFEDQPVLVVRRFDRLSRDGQLLRVHQEDLCQALAVRPDRKYQQEGGPSPEDVGRLLRRLLPAPQASVAIGQFVDALLFNWLIGGTDAHAKNHGLLLSGRQVRFAPLYDVASMLPYEHDPLQLRLAMRIGGEYRLKAIRPRDWEKLASSLDLDADAVRIRAGDLAGRIADAIATAVAALPVEARDTRMPERLLDAVGAWSARCARALDVA